jgi:hypothetical protein
VTGVTPVYTENSVRVDYVSAVLTRHE